MNEPRIIHETRYGTKDMSIADVLLQNNNLTNEQISCFTIKDSDGRNYSLGYDGKLIDNSN